MKSILQLKPTQKGIPAFLSPPLWVIVIAVIILASCKKTDPTPEPSFHLNLSTNKVESPATTGGTYKVGIQANAPWKVTMPAGTNWIELNKTSGTGNDSIQVKIIQANNSPTKRSVVINVTLDNGKASKEFTVEQDFTVAPTLNVQWKKLFGGSGNDYGYSITKSPDGGYLLSGRTTSNNNGDVGPTKGGIDMWAAKLDAAGAITWHKTYGGNSDEYSVAATATPDGGYVMTGFTITNNNGDVGPNHGNTDFWVVKINATGTLQWQKVLGGNGDDRPNAVTVTTEGKIVVAGYTTSNNNGDVGANHGAEDMWVVMLDNANGNIISKKTLGGNGSENAKALAPAPDGGFFVGGTSTSNNNGDVGPGKGSNDFWILKLDNNLNIVWKKSMGGTHIEDLHALSAGPDNFLIAAGSTKSNSTGDVGASNGGEDIWVIKLNGTNGNVEWQKLFGGLAIDVAKGVLVRPNGKIAIAGYSYSSNTGDVETNKGAGDFWILQLASNGTIEWKKLLGGDNEDLASSITSGADGFIVSGSTLSNNSGDVGPGKGNSDIWVVKVKDN